MDSDEHRRHLSPYIMLLAVTQAGPARAPCRRSWLGAPPPQQQQQQRPRPGLAATSPGGSWASGWQARAGEPGAAAAIIPGRRTRTRPGPGSGGSPASVPAVTRSVAAMLPSCARCSGGRAQASPSPSPTGTGRSSLRVRRPKAGSH